MTEIVAMFCNNHQTLKGRTASCDFPESVKTIPVVASIKPDYEKLKTLGIQAVVYDSVLYNEQDIEKLKSAGLQVFGFKENTIDGYTRELYELGNQLGGETSISDYVDKIGAARSSAVAEASTPRQKVTVLLPGGGSGDMILGTDSFVAEEVRASGGDPVGAKADKFVALNPEVLATLNPDFIIIPVSIFDPGGAAKIVNSVLSDPRFKNINAIKNKHILPMDEEVVLRKGARVDKLIESIHKSLVTH